MSPDKTVPSRWLPWSEAMTQALYGTQGFYRQPAGPASHFRTSAHASSAFAIALNTLIERVFTQLGTPSRMEIVEIGAGRGELLRELTRVGSPKLRDRLTFTGVEVTEPPPGLAREINWITVSPEKTDAGLAALPAFSGVLIANEWLDNIVADVVERDEQGQFRLVEVDVATGEERLGAAPSPTEAEWLTQWWPLWATGERAELGIQRDTAWSRAVTALTAGVAVGIDYAHLRRSRPPAGTLTGYAHGRQVAPVPDRSCDLTAHVALDSAAAAGERAGAEETVMLSQRAALRALGLSAAQPPHELSRRDPAAYLRQLSLTSEVSELINPTGLGGFQWLAQSKNLPPAGLSAVFAEASR